MSPNLRILHVILTPRYSGAEILVRDLSLIHAAAGHRVGVCAMNPPEPDFLREIERTRAGGVQWMMPDVAPGRLGRLLNLRRAARRFGPDVVVAHSVIPSAYARLGMPASVPVVSVLHDGSENDYAGGRIRRLEKLISARARALVGVSPRALDNYARNVRPHPRAELILNGIDPGRFTGAGRLRADCRHGFGLGRGDRLIVQVGRVTAMKRQHLTLDAVLPLMAEGPGLQLWFAGVNEDADYLARLRRQVGEAGRADRVRFLGPRPDVHHLLAAADVYVMPSAYESQGIALLEGLASGVSVVASDIPPFRYAADYEGVALVDCADPAAYDAALRAALAEGRRWERDLSAYDIRSTARRYEDLFLEIAGRSLPGAASLAA